MSNSPSPTQLEQAVQFFKSNGYAIVENVFSEEEIDSMKGAIAQIIDDLDTGKHPKSIFSSDEDRHVSDNYFLESVDKIRYFYEEGAVNAEGNLTRPKELAINKIGHALHWLDPTFKQLTFSPAVKAIVKAIGYVQPKLVQSMYIFKQPSIGGAVLDHVDATFLHVDPPDNLLGVWIALDDANQSNGCLWFIPRSHKENTLADGYRFVRCNTGGALLKFEGTRPTYDQSAFVPVEVKKGSLVLIHGKVVHKSEKNNSIDKSRHAYTFHLIDFNELATWSDTNWLQQTDNYKFPLLYEN